MEGSTSSHPLGFRYLTSLPYKLNESFQLVCVGVVDNFKEKRPLLNLAFQIRKEYAYSIERMGSNDVKYTGNPRDIKGVVFLLVRAYKDGFELPKQVSTFTPSKYNNAIKIVKMDRNDERPYEFDIGMNSDKQIFIISSPTKVTQLLQIETIKKYIPLTERQKQYFF